MKVTSLYPSRGFTNRPKVILDFDSESPMVTIMVTIPVGSQNEKPSQYGLAHMLEHFIFRGSKSKPSMSDLWLPFVASGIELNGETDRTSTSYYVHCVPNVFLQALSLLFELVKQPALNKSDLNKIRSSTMNELYLTSANPLDFIIDQIFLPLVLQPWAPLQHSPAGTSRHLRRISYQNLVDFYTLHYTQVNKIKIFVQGNFLPSIAPNQISNFHFQSSYQQILDIWNSIEFSNKTAKRVEEKAPIVCPSKGFLKKRKRSHTVRWSHLRESYIIIGWSCAVTDLTRSAPLILEWCGAYLTQTLISKLYLDLRVNASIVYNVSSIIESFPQAHVFGLLCETYEAQKVDEIIAKVTQECLRLHHFDNEIELLRWIRYMDAQTQINRHNPLEAVTALRNQFSQNSLQKISGPLSTEQIRQLAQVLFRLENRVVCQLLGDGKIRKSE
jgi:predicted Zn-dependent peptidase